MEAVAAGSGPGWAGALREEVLQWLFWTSTSQSFAGRSRGELAAWFEALPDSEETRGKVSAVEAILLAPANVPPSP